GGQSPRTALARSAAALKPTPFRSKLFVRDEQPGEPSLGIPPRAHVALAGPPDGAARRGLALARHARSDRGAPARAEERGVGRREPLSRAAARAARAAHRPRLHGGELPCARRTRGAGRLRANAR